MNSQFSEKFKNYFKNLIMRLSTWIYRGLTNFIYLFRSQHPFQKRIMIFLYWLRIIFKYFIISNIFKIKKEKIFGFEILSVNYYTLLFLFNEIFYKNEYLFRADNQSPVIIDCGANIGFASIYFKWLYPESTIYAFEPDKLSYELLKFNIEKNNLKNVFIFNSAISDFNGKIDLFNNTEPNTFLSRSTKRTSNFSEKVSVDSITLSSVIENYHIERIDLIKMDIEGSEVEVINDLDKHNILSKIDKFVIEYHHKINGQKSSLGDFLKIFEKHGFEYQIDAKNIPVYSENKYQDILLYIYKPN